MPVFELPKNILFPPVHFAEKDGLLAIGGDLSPKRIITAYKSGIFPWYDNKNPILWWSPNPRCVVFPEKIYISASMKKLIRQRTFEVTIDHCFEKVIEHCQKTKRPNQKGTWITHEMKAAYIKLHHLNIAHSIEVWQNNELVGGLYGLALGQVFFGESMFSKVSNASKYGMIMMCQLLTNQGVRLIDCQVTNDHLLSLGAEEIDRNAFIELLNSYIQTDKSVINYDESKFILGKQIF
jgi:leucyl/phenylalanyl-tRNA---protein transferase